MLLKKKLVKQQKLSLNNTQNKHKKKKKKIKADPN